MLGKSPISSVQSLFIDGVEIRILKGCAGADNLFFVLSTVIIYMLMFRLTVKFNIIFICISSVLVSIVINVSRNSLISLIVSSKNSYKDSLYIFLHNSYGSLFFSFISVTIISLIYFRLLNKELKHK